MRALVFIVPGVIFAFGLMLSGMADPAKVMGFLDLLGDWDPSLAVVMAGALLTYVVMNRLLARRDADRAAKAEPVRGALGRTLLGAAMFGVGWGLAGVCPGPALANLGASRPEVLWFVPAMLIGMAAAQRFAAADQ